MDKEQTAIERLKTASELSLAYYQKPLVVCHSGGKDSVVTTELARRANIPFVVSHSHTSVDAPETVYFIRGEFKRLETLGVECKIEYPEYRQKRATMWSLIVDKKRPPTRLVRYCCEVLKESAGKNSFIATGVRWGESVRRKNSRGIYEKKGEKNSRIILSNDNDDTRKLFDSCRITQQHAVAPIIDWTDADVWNYIHNEHLPINPLYGCGFSRVGCIGCPMAGKKRYTEFARYPKYEEAYMRAFAHMIEARKAAGKSDETWETPKKVFEWWMEDENVEGQMDLFGGTKGEEE